MLIPCRTTLIGSGSAWLAGADITGPHAVVFDWRLHRDIADASIKRTRIAVICFVNFLTPFRIKRLLTDGKLRRLPVSLASRTAGTLAARHNLGLLLFLQFSQILHRDLQLLVQVL